MAREMAGMGSRYTDFFSYLFNNCCMEGHGELLA